MFSLYENYKRTYNNNISISVKRSNISRVNQRRTSKCWAEVRSVKALLDKIKTLKEKPKHFSHTRVIKYKDANEFNNTAIQDKRYKLDLINYITRRGGVIFNEQFSLFIFRKSLNVKKGFPWAHHQTGIPDIYNSICHINKLSDDSAIDYKLFEFF
ncbi:hypothetical protein GLOIN_2v1520573 [Rhizophagus clarus]|uniref:Uncharacterized protein n=1 Tax=Rhizophagus clarus TaxID=94130 RepID=A0A8H3QJ01_9GLOM|nr:hypothetical protein GLOIN_2v1520573 [Rhizophagus clarus]